MNEIFSFKVPIALENEVSLDLNKIGAGVRLTLEITGLASLANVGKGHLCFCDREPGPELITLTSGAIVLTSPELAPTLVYRFPDAVWIAVPDPRAVFIDLSSKLLAEDKTEVSNAVPRPFGIASTATIGSHAVIHPYVRIDEGVSIGNHCVIHRGTWVKANAVIRDHAVIGCDGINAYRGLDGKQRGFPHLASVIIGESTEIGAGVVIPRGILASTFIGNDVVVGNLCNIGHGAVIADNVWMSVGCLIGGHTKIGRKVTLAMGVTVRDNLNIGEEVQVGMGSVVVRNVESGVSIFGNPARVTGSKLKAGPAR